MTDHDSDRIHRGVWIAKNAPDMEAELLELADRAEAAGKTLAELNVRDGAGPDSPWRVKDFADYAQSLRQEAADLWEG